MDGLVLDSETTYIQAWRQAATALGYPLTGIELANFSGMSGDELTPLLYRQFGNDFDLPGFQRLSGQYWHSQVRQHGIPVKKGFHSLQQRLQQAQIPYALATNSRRHQAELCLELAGLSGLFPLIVSRDDVQRGKPAPDIFLAVAATLGFAMPDCLVLEDSAVGVSAALAAGAPCLYIPSEQPADPLLSRQATAVFADLEQAADFIMA